MIGIELKFEVRDILMEGIEKRVYYYYIQDEIFYDYLPPLVITEQEVTEITGNT